MGLPDGSRGFKFNARKAAIGSFSHYFHQRKLEKLKNVELAKEWAVCKPDEKNGWVHKYELDITNLKILDFIRKINQISRKPINKGKSRVYTGKDGDFTTNLLLFKSLAIMNM